MGYVVIGLFARQGGYDLLADPLGWVLVLVGVRRLPSPIARGSLLYLGALALAVSVPLWFPDVLAAVAAEDESLAWAADLPALGFAALLFHQLGQAAQRARERTSMTVLHGLVTLTAVVAVLPVLVFGAGLDGLEDLAGGAGQVLHLATVLVLFTYSGRRWAGAPAPPGAAGT